MLKFFPELAPRGSVLQETSPNLGFYLLLLTTIHQFPLSFIPPWSLVSLLPSIPPKSPTVVLRCALEHLETLLGFIFSFLSSAVCLLQEIQESPGTLVQRDKSSLIDSAAKLSKQKGFGSWPEKYSADRLMQQQRKRERQKRGKGSGISQSRAFNLFISLFCCSKPGQGSPVA